MTLQRTLDQCRMGVGASDDQHLPGLESGLAQMLMLVELFARGREPRIHAKHCSAEPAGCAQRCDPAGAQRANTGNSDPEEQHPTQEPESSAGRDTRLDIIDHVLFFVAFEHHRVGMMNRHAQVFTTQPDLAKIIDRGLCRDAIGKDRRNVVMNSVLRGLFRREHDPVEVPQDLGLVSGSGRPVGCGEGPQRHAISRRDRNEQRLIIGI